MKYTPTGFNVFSGSLRRCVKKEKFVKSRLLCSFKDGATNERDVKDHAEIAIIGGGCVGTSIAYHLAKQGKKDVLLLEKSELTAGSTWHAAGLTTSYHPTPNVKRLHWYSINLYTELTKETEQEVGFHRPGSIRLITSDERMKEARYVLSRNHPHDAFMWLISPEEIQKMIPYINLDSVQGGLYTPGDGHIDPYSLTHALAAGARKYGAKILLSSPVEKLNQKEDGTWMIDTPNGSIHAKHIVNAAGFWAREVGKMAGEDHPLIPLHHQYVVTSTIPEVQACLREMPVVRDLEGSYYIRQERNGLLVGPYERTEKVKAQADWWDGVTPGFGKELFESDLDRIMENIEYAMHRFPCLETADIQSIVAGPITYNPDILPMLGPSSFSKNYWCAMGFGYGVVHAGGAGKFLADWMMNGEPPFELSELDPARYGKWTTKEYVLDKCRESYGLNNVLVYPKEERYDGRPVRKSTLYDVLKSAGAQYTFSSGWEVPKWYAKEGDIAGYHPSFERTNWFQPLRREVTHASEGVCVADVSAFAKLYVEGNDAENFLNHMVANKLPKVGRTNVSHMLTPSGKVYAEVTISTLEKNKYLVITGGGSEYHDLRWLKDHMKHCADVVIKNKTDEQTAIAVTGPKAREVLQSMTSNDMSNDSFKFMQNKQMELAGVPVIALRVSYTGELGWELYVDNEHAVELYESIMQHGGKYDIGHIGGYAINSMRIEKGFRLWGNEMNLDTTPFEAGLHSFIKINKGDFLGRNALINEEKVLSKRRLVCMTVDTDNVDAEGDEAIWFGDKVVGNTTSGCFGYMCNKSIAYGYVPLWLKEVGTEVEIELVGRKYVATVVAEPLIHMEPTRNRKSAKGKN